MGISLMNEEGLLEFKLVVTELTTVRLAMLLFLCFHFNSLWYPAVFDKPVPEESSLETVDVITQGTLVSGVVVLFVLCLDVNLQSSVGGGTVVAVWTFSQLLLNRLSQAWGI